MEQKLLDTIMAGSFTQTQALKRLRDLKEFLVNKLFTSGSKELQILTTEDPWLSTLNPDFFSQFDKKNTYHLFEAAEKAIKKMSVLIIYVAVELPEAEIAKLGAALRQVYGKKFLLEIKLDPGLIGGASLVWNGVYRDYSIRKKITDNRQVILNSLKSYVHK